MYTTVFKADGIEEFAFGGARMMSPDLICERLQGVLTAEDLGGKSELRGTVHTRAFVSTDASGLPPSESGKEAAPTINVVVSSRGSRRVEVRVI